MDDEAVCSELEDPAADSDMSSNSKKNNKEEIDYEQSDYELIDYEPIDYEQNDAGNSGNSGNIDSSGSLGVSVSPRRKGLVHIYTGDGKGKTSAAMGLALRSVGHGHKVYIIQFLKGGHYTGELIASETIFKKLGNFVMRQFGKGCIKTDKQTRLSPGPESCPKNFNIRDDVPCGECRQCFLSDGEEEELIRSALEHTKEILQSDDIDVVVLDEINHLFSKNMITVSEAASIISSRKPHIELVLTGRNAPQELIDIADLVTEMKEIKHPFNKGIEGRKGIEY